MFKSFRQKWRTSVFASFAYDKVAAAVSVKMGKWLKVPNSTPNMTRRRFHRATEVSPRRPWKSKSPFASRPLQRSEIQGRKGHAQGTTRYFLHSFPSHGPPVVQSYRSQTNGPWPEFPKNGSKMTKKMDLGSFSVFHSMPGHLLQGTEPPLTLRQENHYLYFGHFFPCTPGPFSL